MKYFDIDIGNGPEGYDLPTQEAALKTAHERVAASFHENYERGMSAFYKGHTELDLIEFSLENDSPVSLERIPAWADFEDCGIYKQSRPV